VTKVTHPTGIRCHTKVMSSEPTLAVVTASKGGIGRHSSRLLFDSAGRGEDRSGEARGDQKSGKELHDLTEIACLEEWKKEGQQRKPKRNRKGRRERERQQAEDTMRASSNCSYSTVSRGLGAVFFFGESMR